LSWRGIFIVYFSNDFIGIEEKQPTNPFLKLKRNKKQEQSLKQLEVALNSYLIVTGQQVYYYHIFKQL